MRSERRFGVVAWTFVVPVSLTRRRPSELLLSASDGQGYTGLAPPKTAVGTSVRQLNMEAVASARTQLTQQLVGNAAKASSMRISAYMFHTTHKPAILQIRRPPVTIA